MSKYEIKTDGDEWVKLVRDLAFRQRLHSDEIKRKVREATKKAKAMIEYDKVANGEEK